MWVVGHGRRLPCGPCPLILPGPTHTGRNPASAGPAAGTELRLTGPAPLVDRPLARGAGAGGPARHRRDGLRLLRRRRRRRAAAGRERGGVGPLAAPPAGAGRDRRVSTATTLLGSPVGSPVGIAPTAIQGLAHPEGEVATARGAAAAGALMILSSLATCSLEDVAAAAPDGAAVDADLRAAGPGPDGRAGRTDAWRAGYRALVLTVDAPVSGLRLREWRDGRAPARRPGPAEPGRGQHRRAPGRAGSWPW